MEACRIQWIDEKGKPTPDTRDAITHVRCTGKGLQRYLHENQGRTVAAEPSEWFPCCEMHLAQAHREGLFASGEWEFAPMPPAEPAKE